MRATTNQLPLNDASPWWDNVSTKNVKENRATIFKLAFDSTIIHLQKELGTDVSHWTWGNVHTIEQTHPLEARSR